MDQHIRAQKKVTYHPVQTKAKTTKFEKRTSETFNRRPGLTEYTATDKLDRIKRDLKKNHQPQIFYLPKKDAVEVKLPPPELTEPHASNTPFISQIQKFLSPLAKIAAGIIVFVTLGVVKPDFAKAAPKHKAGTELVDEGKKGGKEAKAPEIFGQGKYFDKMEFDEKTGILHVSGSTDKGLYKVNEDYPMRAAATELSEVIGKKFGKTFSFEGLPIGFVNITIPGIEKGSLGVGTYIIYDDVVFYLSKRAVSDSAVSHVLWALDGSKICRNEGAIYIHEDGSLLATTPTTLIGFTKNWSGAYKYAGSIFKVDSLPQLEFPIFSPQMSGSKIVEMRDPSLSKKERLKLLISMGSFNVDCVPDEAVAVTVGAR